MGLAAHILDRDPRDEFRDMIHDEVDKWVDVIIDEVFKEGKTPTVMELSELFTKTKREFFGACFQALIEQKYAGMLAQEYASCPQCGKMCKKRRDSQKEMETMQGPSALKRPWYYCVDCSPGCTPPDKVLEISRKKYQFDIQKKSTRTAAEVPFSCGGDLFAELTGHSISDHFMHETFEAMGSFACLPDVIPNRKEIAKRCKSVSKGSWRPVLVVASDGAHVPTRSKAGRNEKRGKGRWQEAKGFRIYLLGENRESSMSPVGIKSTMRSNSVRICLWWLRESHKTIFALDCWEMEPNGCGNTWSPAFPRDVRYWIITIARSISTKWRSFSTGKNHPNVWNGWKAR